MKRKILFFKIWSCDILWFEFSFIVFLSTLLAPCQILLIESCVILQLSYRTKTYFYYESMLELHEERINTFKLNEKMQCINSLEDLCGDLIVDFHGWLETIRWIKYSFFWVILLFLICIVCYNHNTGIPTTSHTSAGRENVSLKQTNWISYS